MVKLRTRRSMLLMLFFLILSVIFVVVFSTDMDSQDDMDGVYALQLSGSYCADGGEWTDFTSADELSGKACGELVMKVRFPEEVFENGKLHAMIRDVCVEIRSAGKQVYFNDYRSVTTGLTFNSYWISCALGEFSADGTAEIIFTGSDCRKTAEQFVSTACAGEDIYLFHDSLKNHMWQILIGFIMLSCGIALTITVISMNMVGVGSTMDFIYCGVLLIFGAVCTLIDYDYIQFIFNNAGFVNDVDFLSQIFICAFIIMYMRTFIENKNMKKVVMMVATLMGASVPVCLSMRNFGLCMLNDFVWVLIPVFIVLIIATGFVLVAEYLKNRNKRTLVILQSTIVVAVFAVAEMLRFFLFGEYWIVLFQIGLLYFTVTQFYYLLKITGETIIMARNAERAQRELTEVKTQIMLSQIQPHFLYNALASIAQLCRKDPKQAEKTTVDFAKYLRLNLDSLENNRPVPFETELKHIETYLNIEQLRFGEKLKTRYDIQTKDFRLPALTVQPLVENAVKHGIFAKESGGTIVISSLEDEHSYIILVSDDGCGFVPGRPPEDGRNHIGLENVKNRLSAICGGTLEIESEPGEGTTATVRIPKLD